MARKSGALKSIQNFGFELCFELFYFDDVSKNSKLFRKRERQLGVDLGGADVNRQNTQLKILQYLYTVDSVPRKQIKIAIQDVAYNTVARATRELLDKGYAEVYKDQKKATRIKITRAGISYLTKNKKLPQNQNKEIVGVRRLVTSNQNRKERIERVQKTVDLCKAAELTVSGETNLTFDCFSSNPQSDEVIEAFSTVYVESALFFRADEVTRAIKKAEMYGEEITQTQSRFTGIVINKNGIWVLYHTLNRLMQYTKSIENTMVTALMTYIKKSWIVQQYPDFFKYLKQKPVAIVIGDTPSMLPKIFTGRKWGEKETDSQQKQHAATRLACYENMIQTFRNVEFVPNNEVGRNYLHRIVCMTQAEILIMCQEWAKRFDYSCTVINNLYQISRQKQDSAIILPTISLNMVVRIRNLSAPVKIVIERGMAESVSRVLGTSMGNAMDYELTNIKTHRYNLDGVRIDGINPLTKKGHFEGQ